MRREVPITVRVPADLKDRVDVLASEIGISSSAVWKILLHRSVKPLIDGEAFTAVDLFGAQAAERGATDARIPGAPGGIPGSTSIPVTRGGPGSIGVGVRRTSGSR